jgi:hypothetical protein
MRGWVGSLVLGRIFDAPIGGTQQRPARGAAPIIADTPLELSWRTDTCELHMCYPRPPTLFTGNAMPINVLMLMDSLMERTDAPGGLVKTCEATCASHSLP